MKQPVNNQLVMQAPTLGPGQKWKIHSYLVGNATRNCPKKFNEFDQATYLGQSGDYHHFLGDGTKILVCTIVFNG